MMFDLAIIGGGPAGYVAAERAGAKGLSVVLFEKNKLGGVCLNEGCIPTKTILYSAKLYDSARGSDKYGVKAAEATFDFGKIFERKNRVVRRLVGGIGATMKAHNVNVVTGEAYIRGRGTDGIEVECAGENYTAKNLLVCTGSTAFVPPIEGVADAGDVILTNREVLDLKELPSKFVVIGGGVIGMEFASFFNSLGSEVTVIEMMPEIVPGLDAELSAMLREAYQKKGVKFNLGCKVQKVDGNEVFYTDTEGNIQSVHGDRILVSVGRRPIINGFGLENLGVETERGAVKVDDLMQTNVENVYAAGDITGFSMFAHTASREGEVVVNNLTGIADRMSYDAVPAVVYTNPEVATVGLNSSQAAAAGIPYRESKLPMAYAGRFVAENEGGNGVCKVVVNTETNAVIGVHMLGNPCSEMIFGAGIAIENRMTPEQLAKVIFPHPTVSEIIKETLFTF